MSERITTRRLAATVELLARATGHAFASSYSADPEAWTLDVMNPGDGKTYAIESGHGSRRPLGDRRWRARELYDACHFALRAVEAAKERRP